MNIRHDRVIVFVVRHTEAGISHEFLQLRRVGDDTDVTWQTISGAMLHNETAWQTALRALREQAGLSPTEFYRVDRPAGFYTAKDDTLWNCPQFCAVVERSAPMATGSRHDAIRWVDRKYAKTLFIWPSERQTLAEICDEILDDGPARGYLRIPLPAAS